MGKSQPRGDERGRQKRDKRRQVGQVSCRFEEIKRNFRPGRHKSVEQKAGCGK